MSNRTFHRKQSLDREVKELFLEVSFGATGAPTIVNGLGFASIARSAQGDYLVTLSDKYHGGLKSFHGVLLDADGEDIHFQLKAESVAASKTLSFYTITGSTATDPSNGSKAFISVCLKNTTVL